MFRGHFAIFNAGLFHLSFYFSISAKGIPKRAQNIGFDEGIANIQSC